MGEPPLLDEGNLDETATSATTRDVVHVDTARFVLSPDFTEASLNLDMAELAACGEQNGHDEPPYVGLEPYVTQRLYN